MSISMCSYNFNLDRLWHTISLREPLNVPSTQTLDVLDNDFKGAEVERSDRIESDIEEDEGPFEEGVSGVCWLIISVLCLIRNVEKLSLTSWHPVHLVLNKEIDQ